MKTFNQMIADHLAGKRAKWQVKDRARDTERGPQRQGEQAAAEWLRAWIEQTHGFDASQMTIMSAESKTPSSLGEFEARIELGKGNGFVELKDRIKAANDADDEVAALPLRWRAYAPASALYFETNELLDALLYATSDEFRARAYDADDEVAALPLPAPTSGEHPDLADRLRQR